MKKFINIFISYFVFWGITNLIIILTIGRMSPGDWSGLPIALTCIASYLIFNIVLSVKNYIKIRNIMSVNIFIFILNFSFGVMSYLIGFTNPIELIESIMLSLKVSSCVLIITVICTLITKLELSKKQAKKVTQKSDEV